eukprot:4431137-Pleurochrysis_carterae.AAC.1
MATFDIIFDITLGIAKYAIIVRTIHCASVLAERSALRCSRYGSPTRAWPTTLERHRPTASAVGAFSPRAHACSQD